MSDMHNLPQPGEALRDDLLSALGLTITESARHLGVTRAVVSRVLNGRAAMSPDMALRLEAWLGPERGSRAQFWVGQQMVYDKRGRSHGQGSHSSRRAEHGLPE